MCIFLGCTVYKIGIPDTNDKIKNSTRTYFQDYYLLGMGQIGSPRTNVDKNSKLFQGGK